MAKRDATRMTMPNIRWIEVGRSHLVGVVSMDSLIEVP